MRRRSRAGGEPVKTRRRKTAARKPRNAPPIADRRGSATDQEMAFARVIHERDQALEQLSEALEQQTATSELLKVISNSASDLQAVFNAMAENAVRLCEAERAYIFRFDGEYLRAVAACNAGPENWDFVSRNPIKPGRQTVSARAALERRTVHVPDVQADPEYAYVLRDVEPIHTTLSVPIIKGDDLVGTITIYRLEVKPFTDKQVALVETFAAQAVIAIENTRLLNELRQSLQQQTATADVLKIISRSTFDLKAVLNTLVEFAARLCEADMAVIGRPKGATYYFEAGYGLSPEYAEFVANNPAQIDRASVSGRVLVEGKIVHIPDAVADPEYTFRGREIGGFRTVLGVPLLREGTPIGVIALGRKTVRPFTDKQIELVTTFADQAVIAIENVRLFEAEQQRSRELSKSLEQQTATSEVLGVISSSPGDLQPVFATILENATRICAAKFGTLLLCEGNAFRFVAMHNAPTALAELRHRQPVLEARPGMAFVRSTMSKRAIQIADITEDQAYIERDPTRLEAAELGGYRAVLSVPMLKDDESIGAFNIYRQEPGPFTDKQIALATTFAAQAVIAIENARLLNELRQRTTDLTESLEQQTATADVLKIIGSFPGELEPVFQAILKNASHICGAKFGTLYLYDGDAFHATAFHNAPPAFAEYVRRGPLRPGPNVPLARMARTKQVVHDADIRKEQAYIDREPLAVAGADLGGYRTLLAVPMLKENTLVGEIVIFRQEVRPFTDKQIALVQNFAAQAVIAIENARLLNELRQSLEQQTATADVLRIISSSPGELEPVFQAMLENAVRICASLAPCTVSTARSFTSRRKSVRR